MFYLIKLSIIKFYYNIVNLKILESFTMSFALVE